MTTSVPFDIVSLCSYVTKTTTESNLPLPAMRKRVRVPISTGQSAPSCSRSKDVCLLIDFLCLVKLTAAIKTPLNVRLNVCCYTGFYSQTTFNGSYQSGNLHCIRVKKLFVHLKVAKQSCITNTDHRWPANLYASNASLFVRF